MIARSPGTSSSQRDRNELLAEASRYVMVSPWRLPEVPRATVRADLDVKRVQMPLKRDWTGAGRATSSSRSARRCGLWPVEPEF